MRLTAKRDWPLDVINHGAWTGSGIVLERIQHMHTEEIAECQAMIGHGHSYGRWETPKDMIGRTLTPAKAKIILRDRVIQHLPESYHPTPSLISLLDEAEIWLARYALLIRLGPSSSRRTNGYFLDPTTIANILYASIPKILAAGIVNRCENADLLGLVSCLTSSQIDGYMKGAQLHRLEFRRMHKLVELGLWSDGPSAQFYSGTLDPAGARTEICPEDRKNPWQPLPDSYLSSMGQKVISLAELVGPKVIAILLEVSKCPQDSFAESVRKVLDGYDWGECTTDLEPIINLGSVYKNSKNKETIWPPRDFSELKVLCGALQSAHLWLLFIAMGGRCQEVLSVRRDAIVETSGGTYRVKGRTFKFVLSHFGEERIWNIPPSIAVFIVQQSDLVAAISKAYDARQSIVPASLDYLFVKLTDKGQGEWFYPLVDANHALMSLAKRLGFSPNPGGHRIHTHRFRKTVARLAALAITESPMVLKNIFGHQNIEQTLSYMLSDKSLQADIALVARELRILRCSNILEVVRDANEWRDGTYAGYGGGAMPSVMAAIRAKNREVSSVGAQWNDKTTLELATLLSLNGEGYRIIRPGVICIKPGKSFTPCNCGSDCVSRIEDRLARRDVELVFPALLAQGSDAHASGNLLLLSNILDQCSNELSRFEGIEISESDLFEYRRLITSLELACE